MEPRKQNDRLAPLETGIMNARWEISSATARTVRRRMGRDLAYTTARTMLNAKEARDGND